MYYYIGGLADSDTRLSLFLSFDFLQATFLYINLSVISAVILKGTDQASTFMSLKCVVYYVNYRSWHLSSKIQVIS